MPLSQENVITTEAEQTEYCPLPLRSCWATVASQHLFLSVCICGWYTWGLAVRV